MPPPARKAGGSAWQSELVFDQPLRNCLVNLPFALVDVLVENNIAAQNVVVELTFRQSIPKDDPSKSEGRTIQRSVYLGWTGLQSKRKLAPIVARDGFTNRSNNGAQGKEVPLVEMSPTFAKMLGLEEAQQVGVLLHSNPPQAHTVNIEPLTTADWELLELHANFLEINMLSQIRALPNPAYKSASGLSPHPITLHLSPTTTANIIVTSLLPAPPSTSPFAKIASDAEVHVAPKVRAKAPSETSREIRGAGSVDERSATSTSRTRSTRNEHPPRQPVFLRGVDRSTGAEYFDNLEEIDKDLGLKVWVDWSILTSKELRGVTWVLVSIVRPSGLQAPSDPQHEQDAPGLKAASRIVAQICPWEEAPDSRHAALSSALCAVLDADSVMGETIRLEPAPTQIPRPAVKLLKSHPFLAKGSSKTKDGFQFGSKSKADREEAAKRLLVVHSKLDTSRLLDGPLTDGMILPSMHDADTNISWPGGILKFDPPQDNPKAPRAWFLGSDRKIIARSAQDADSATASKLPLEVTGDPIKKPNTSEPWTIGQSIPKQAPKLMCVDKLLGELTSHVKHGSSILLTGGRGSGKSAMCQLLAHRLRNTAFYHVTMIDCHSLNTDETRVSSIKDVMSRTFGLAAWGARNGGGALVVLDNLDSICPTETELQVGNDNDRSRQVSEIVISMTKQFCSTQSRVVLLATAKSKEDTNNAIIGGHVVKEIVNIPAPDKQTRRTILQGVVSAPAVVANVDAEVDNSMLAAGSVDVASRSPAVDSDHGDFGNKTSTFAVDPSIDFLDIAGQADGFMPGDLLLLASRARSESLIRCIADSDHDELEMVLKSVDFASALKGFTPSSLRNVTLQHSTVTFSSIGGLTATRQTLLETLQYPTLYAPIFAQCPLRLRSGLLLYGFPGCGKTLLASAVAGECGLNFISVKGPEILNKYIGASEKSVRDLFERAQAARPCVLFFDEFDSVAPKRGHDSTGVTDRVVNQLLTQMDGAEGLSGVYVLAATSRPDLIDPALLRPGRLDKSLLCDMPDLADRADILRALSQKLRINPSLLGHHGSASSSETLEEVARRTDGYSGADLQAVIYNAHLEAIHDVLGDRHGGGRGESKSSRKNHTTNGTAASTKGLPDFTYFRYGDGAQDDTTPSSAAVRATERNAIANQLASHRAAQSRARAAKHAATSSSQGRRDDGDRDADKHEPTIEWVHIERSLEQTRPSISREERQRLTNIYREFVVGRNGEMPSGQGGIMHGTRSSLM